jgi:membrane fusion protein, heavy metal efflux system
MTSSDTAPSNTRLPLLVAAGLGFVVLALAWWLSRPGAGIDALPVYEAELTEDGAVILPPEMIAAAGLVVVDVESDTRPDTFEATALVALDETRTARIGSLVEGVVSATYREVGARVPAGTVLAAIHSHVVHDAWAGYRKAVADRRRLANEVSYVTQAEARATRLFADRAVSAQAVERAEADRLAAEEQLIAADAELRRAADELEHLGIDATAGGVEEDADRIPARAPIGGVVLERLVTPGTAVTPGTPLFVVSDLASVWVLAEIDERRIAQVAVGQPAIVRVSAYPDDTFAGRVTFVGDTVNPRTRRVLVRCEVPNPEGLLKPEMFATVTLGSGEPRTVVTVPAVAVHDLDGHTVVFVEEAPGRLRPRRVVVASERDGRVDVIDGLSRGMRVATTGSFLVKSELLRSALVED